MQRAIKVRLLPTDEQERLFWQSAGVARWAYNYFLAENERLYQLFKESGKGNKSISEGAIRKHINQVLKPTTHSWLNSVGSNVMKQAVKDADLARKRWFQGLAKKPKFKTRHKTTPSFYVNYESLKRTCNGFRGEKIGIVKTTSPLPKIPRNKKYSNPRITFDGRYWYLSVGFQVAPKKVELNNHVIGIDVGLKELAVTSDNKFYKNINKSNRVKKLLVRHKREQRKLSRMLLSNIKGYMPNRKPIWKRPIKECKNVQKQIKIVNRLYKKLTNIRQNYLHQVSSEIVKTKPSRIVMETLNIKGMMKNRHLSKAFSNQKLHEFTRQIKYKCENLGIEFIQVSQWFASSKLCSCCGNKKIDLKLSDRVYRCDNCKMVIDRDYNASINLANYKI